MRRIRLVHAAWLASCGATDAGRHVLIVQEGGYDLDNLPDAARALVAGLEEGMAAR